MVVGVLSDVQERFAVGSVIDVVPVSGPRHRVRISSVRGDRKQEAIIGLEGLETRDSAELLRGAVLEVERSQIPEAPPGSFYYFELVGCKCADTRGGHLGTVTGVQEDGGGLLLEITARGSKILVPFVKAYLKSMNTRERRIELELPEGLVETCTSAS